MLSKKLLSTLINGLANFSTQYNFQAISAALLIMSATECTLDDLDCQQGHQKEWVRGTSEAVIFVGAIVGQLSMGYAGDLLGRSRALLMTLSIAFISALLSAIASLGSPKDVYAIIITFRFFLGVGLGGVYPLSATKASEDSGEAGKVNSTAAAWSFFWQMPGLIVPWFFAFVFVHGDHSLLPTSMQWRLILGFGAIPIGFSIIAILLEQKYYPTDLEPPSIHDNLLDYSVQDQKSLLGLNYPNQPSFSTPVVVSSTTSSSGGTKGSISESHLKVSSSFSHHSSSNQSSHSLNLPQQLQSSGILKNPHETPLLNPLHQSDSNTSLTQHESDEEDGLNNNNNNTYPRQTSLEVGRPTLHEHGDNFLQDMWSWDMLGAGGGWFLYDVAFYGTSLFGASIIKSISNTDDNVTSDKSVSLISSHQMIAQSMAIPGTFLAIYALPSLGLKKLQIFSFLFVAVMFLLVACLFDPLSGSNNSALFGVYCMLTLSLQMGVNITTYCMPAAVFPKKIRATYNGIASALGKLGAVAGAYIFAALIDQGTEGYSLVMGICCGVALLGAIVTKICILTQRLEESVILTASQKYKKGVSIGEKL